MVGLLPGAALGEVNELHLGLLRLRLRTLPANAGFPSLSSKRKSYELRSEQHRPLCCYWHRRTLYHPPLGAEITASGRANRAVEEPTQAQVVLDGIVNKLTKACVDYRISKADTKLEREAKNCNRRLLRWRSSHRAVSDYVLADGQCRY